MKRWRYRLEVDFTHTTKLLDGITFISPWLLIQNGQITVYAKYAWDGVTPAYCINGHWIGIWDGPIGEDGLPVTWKATVVHDAFCQFIGLIEGLTKEQTVAVFEELLILNKTPQWMVMTYPFMVHLLGPQDWSN